MTGYLAIDLGKLRVGLASGDDATGVATPLDILDGRDRRALIDRLCALAEERAAEFVLGLPFHVDGSEHRLTRKTRAFATTLERASGRPVHLQDETLSSAEAEQRAREIGRDADAPIDDLAAQIILESFLEARS